VLALFTTITSSRFFGACRSRLRRHVRQFPEVTLVREPKKGLTKARQRGLQEAKGDVIFSIDADTRIPAGWFAAMQEELKKPGVVCVSGPYDFYDVPDWKRACVNAYWRTSSAVTNTFTNYMIVGGNFAVYRKALEQIGGFDTSIDFYGEDTDIARRLHEVGKVVFSPSCVILASGRRMSAEGMVRTPVIYMLNYLWVAAFRKPLTKTYQDIR
jgi:GT2 family glycosyltransferase